MNARIGRIPATCAAIRRAREAAHNIAREADMDGRHGIARALRRKAASTHPRDWEIIHAARHVEARIAAYGIIASGRRHVAEPAPSDTAQAARAALALAQRETIR